jgi:predicted RND superfamily exporter protein
VLDALQRVVGPCLMTSLTAAIGFLSLAVSNVPAMREFAFAASIVMVFEFVFSFFLLPPLLIVLPAERFLAPSTRQHSLLIDQVLSRIPELVGRYAYAVLGAATLLALVATWFTAQVPIETNPQQHLKSSSPVRRSLDFVEQKLGGTMVLDVSLITPEPDGFKSPERLGVIKTLQDFISRQEAVTSTLSLVDFLKEMNQSFHSEDPLFFTLPNDRNLVEQYLLLYDGKDLEDVVTDAFDHARIIVRIHQSSSRNLEALLATIESFIHSSLQPGDIRIRLTGNVRNVVNTANEVVTNQISSFATAALIIAVLLSLQLRSVSLGLLSLIPNVFPILTTFGIMGLAGIPLDTGTVMIASVALGIAVDDTIHVLSAYRTQRINGRPRREAVETVLRTKGRAVIVSALTLTAGFGVLVFGSFVPVVYFGLLTAVTLATAVLAELLLLPALLLLRD